MLVLLYSDNRQLFYNISILKTQMEISNIRLQNLKIMYEIGKGQKHKISKDSKITNDEILYQNTKLKICRRYEKGQKHKNQ